MEQSTAANPTFDALPAGNTVECALPCPHCGYDLFSLNLDAVCPECGEPVRHGMPEGEKIYIEALTPPAVDRVTRRSLFFSGIMGLLTIVTMGVIFLLARMATPAWIILPAMLVGSTIGHFRSWGKIRRKLGEARWMIGENGVARRAAGRPDVLIRGDEVWRIDQTRFGLVVRTRDKRRYITFPKEVESFEEIKTYLSHWSNLRPRSIVWGVSILAFLSFTIFPGFVVAMFSRDRFWIDVAGAILLAVFAWLSWSVARSRMITRRRRVIFFVVCLVVSAVIVFRMITGFRLI